MKQIGLLVSKNSYLVSKNREETFLKGTIKCTIRLKIRTKEKFKVMQSINKITAITTLFFLPSIIKEYDDVCLGKFSVTTHTTSCNYCKFPCKSAACSVRRLLCKKNANFLKTRKIELQLGKFLYRFFSFIFYSIRNWKENRVNGNFSFFFPPLHKRGVTSKEYNRFGRFSF